MSELALRLIAENKRTRATTLDLGNCGLTELPKQLGELVWIERLILASTWYEWDGARWQEQRTHNQGETNSLSGGIELLAGLARLKTVIFLGTKIADLAPLAGLTALQTLDVSGTEITDLAPLAGLTALQTLYVFRTQITDLAPLLPHIRRGLRVHWSTVSRRGPGIYVENCPIINPPIEIVKQGNEAILNYFRERELAGVDHLYEAKMLIVGEGGAGKTSLIRRLYQPNLPLPPESETTRGIYIHRHEFTLPNGRQFRLNVWDFAGQEIYHATHQFFLTRRSLYLLVDDTRKDHKSVSDEGFKYWLELVDVFGGGSPLLIFQNEKGGRTKAIDFDGITARFPNVKKRYGGNLEELVAADALRGAIEHFAANLSHIGDALPASWIKVRAEIEARAAAAPFITQHDYFDICSHHIEFDLERALHLSRYLHDLGVFLHFQDDKLLGRTVILQNQWATEAVFKILDAEPVKARLGRFNEADCERLWCDSVYAHMHPELLALMKRFELCYELRDSNPPTWLAPQLLPPARPAALSGWTQAGDLVLRYRYEFMPKGMISRLIVRLHRFVRNTQLAWHTGVLFEQGSTSLLVEVLPNGDEIELRSRGPEGHALLSIVANDREALNDSFAGLQGKVHKSVPCRCKECFALASPHFFPHQALLRRKEKNVPTITCERTLDEVDVLELLDGVRFTPAASTSTGTPLRIVRIFLASSAELRDDRDAFELYFLQQNIRLLQRGIFLEVVRWENFLDAMSETRLQDEYNKEICLCDLFVSLFFTKTGKYTEEEFDVAHRQFKATTKPVIYTYFKTGHVDIDTIPPEALASRANFQKKLGDLGHFYTKYKNTEDLKLQVASQIDRLLDANRI